MSTWKTPSVPSEVVLRPALFLDRDGVVIADENYLADPGKVRLLPGVAAAMARAREAGFLLIGVSNQSGIGRGYFSIKEFNQVMKRLERLLDDESVKFDSFFYCPHAPGDDCNCRKPKPGLLEEAQGFHSIDLERSWIVGDKRSDVTFGRAAGLGSVLVRTGYGMSEEQVVRDKWAGDPRVLVADDLPAAVSAILDLDLEGGGRGLDA